MSTQSQITRIQNEVSSQTSLISQIQTALASKAGGTTPSGTLSITANGTHDVTQYASASVNVPASVTPITLNRSDAYPNVAYGNGVYVWIADTSTRYTYYSTDGINWVQNTNLYFCGNIAFGNGRFVAYPKDSSIGTIKISYDGINWTSSSYSLTNYNLAIKFVGGRFIAYTTGVGLYSFDGESWTSFSMQENTFPRAVFFFKGTYFIQHDNSSNVWKTVDFVNWTSATTTKTNIYDVVEQNGVLVACRSNYGGAVYYSYDGVNWTGVLLESHGGRASSACAGAGIFIFVHRYQNVFYSFDAINWTRTNIGIISGNVPVIYADGRFLICGQNKSVLIDTRVAIT